MGGSSSSRRNICEQKCTQERAQVSNEGEEQQESRRNVENAEAPWIMIIEIYGINVSAFVASNVVLFNHL